MSDAFLKFVRESRRGRLQIFVGMAAGVGKTVAMLREAKRLQSAGIDVICAFVETHGRAETEREIAGLTLLPRLVREYRGVPLDEMDLEGVLARKPDLAVVDELPHTNVPGGKHDKRYRDVEELLEAGISVLAAMNVQHLESLHDLVMRETGVDVRERIPDRFFHRADELVVIDVPPAELQTRLREGKIYPAHKIEQALNGFFRSENLASLRQLVLREVANEVEEKNRARARPARPTGEGSDDVVTVADAERVMVCMSSQPTATRKLLRQGMRLAGGISSRWFVVYVRTPGESPERIDTPALRSLTENIRVAKEMGAEVRRLEGTEVSETLARFAREHAITHAVFGRTRLPAWRERLRGSLLDRFMRSAPHVDVLVVGARGGEEDPNHPENEDDS